MEMNTSGRGYGIYNTGKMGNIANTGEISELVLIWVLVMEYLIIIQLQIQKATIEI